jgi:hypothetical protein
VPAPERAVVVLFDQLGLRAQPPDAGDPGMTEASVAATDLFARRR